MSDADLANLSEAERAALADEDEQDALSDVVEDTGDVDDDDKSDGDDGEDGDDKVDEADDKPNPKAADEDSSTEADEAGEDNRPFVPRYEAPAVEDYDARIREIGASKAAVLTKFKAGDIEADAMEQELDALDGKRYELERQRTKAEMAAEQADQSARQQWQWEINRFMRSSAKEGVEYRVDVVQSALEKARQDGDAEAVARAERDVRRAKMLNAALDTVVKELGSDEKNANKSSEWFLEEAHRQVKEQFNLGAKAGDKTRTPTRRPDMSKVPKTLAELPNAGSDDASTGDDEFAHLGKLSGMELESAVARMSESQRDRWYRSAA